MNKKPNPIKKEEDVQKNPDEHIDQDFPGFPNAPSDKKASTPKQKQKRNWQVQTKKDPKKHTVVNDCFLFKYTIRSRS